MAELEQAAARYAVSYIYNARPAARMGFDTVTTPPGRRTPAETDVLKSIVRARGLTAASTSVRCGELPSSCRMSEDFDAVVGIRPLDVADGLAHVSIELQAATHLPRVPIVWEKQRVRFVKRGNTWVFDRVEEVEVS